MASKESVQAALKRWDPGSSTPKEVIKELILELDGGQNMSSEEVDKLLAIYSSSVSPTLSLNRFVDWVFHEEAPSPGCHMRILHVNDVYKLDNFPALKTAVQELSAGLPSQNVITSLAGDFLAPSLLSSIDHGRSMVDVMNQVPIRVVCFGNHESDVPYPSLVKRINEFKGSWLNSNMRGFKPELPDNLLVQLEGGRTVGFIGLNIGGGCHSSIYREGAMGGHAKEIVPVLEAVDGAVDRCRLACPDVDAIIPLTHQDMPDDVALAKRGLFPLILGGHDHDEFHEIHSGCHVIKSGADAEKIACIDIIWPEGMPRSTPPQVTCKMIPLAQAEPPVSKFEPDPKLRDMVDQAYVPVRELEVATLAKFPPGSLSSKGIRTGQSSFASEIGKALRDSAGAEGALITSGAIRGDKLYETGFVTYGDLTKECPFPSAMVVVLVPGSVLRDAISQSREAWGRGEADGMSLQVDAGMKMDANGLLSQVAGREFDADAEYKVVLDSYILTANPILKAFAEANPQRIPPSDAGLPPLPMLVDYFCRLAWKELVDIHGEAEHTAADVDKFFDMYATRDGTLHQDEVMDALKTHLPHMASNVVAGKLISCVDLNTDSRASRNELCHVLVSHLKEEAAALG